MESQGWLLLAFDLAAVWPLVRMCLRAGLAPGWAALVFVPVIGLALVLGVLTWKRWPNALERPRRAPKARRVA